MIFEKQEYQQKCLQNIMSILQDFDFKSHDVVNLKDCLQSFYRHNPMPLNVLNNKLNIDILMETGTGKTFTYLNLIFELNKHFKQNKFIIFVPRKAILESVKQNINLTRSYFYSEYGEYLKTYIYSDSKSQSLLANHYIKNSDELSVLILTNSAIDKESNILNQNSEKLFNNKSIFENIIDLKPIAIIDEPHLLKGKAFHSYFSKLNTLYFRFGATFPKEKDFELSNIAYCLDSVSAFRSFLVKQIRVHTILQSNNAPYLLTTQTKNKPKSATFSYFQGNIEKRAMVFEKQDLGQLDSSFIGIVLEKITKDKVYLSNQSIIEKKTSYKLSQDEISNLLSKAIDLHFEKEEKLFQQNIKALSLFFIPEIKDFRGENPFIKNEFERLYKQKRAEILKQDIDKYYREYLQKDFNENGNLKVHQGYFSGDKGNNDEKEAQGVKIILEDKEKLLSFDTPLRFIFSVWALQEGWDNPNIFTLTKLANSSSDTSRHQQVGRGLRVCVNSKGKRVTLGFVDSNENAFFETNRLDMLVSSEERGFIEGLQKEILNSSFVFSLEFIEKEKLQNIGLDEEQIDEFCVSLKFLNLVEYDKNNKAYKIISPIYENIKDNENIKTLLGDKFDSILEFFKATHTRFEQIQNANTPKEKVSIKMHLAKEFKELWQTINTKAKLTYKNLDNQKLIESIAKKFNEANIEQEHIIYETKIYNAKSNHIETLDSAILKSKNYQKELEKTLPNLLLDFAKTEKIPLGFLTTLFSKLKQTHFHNSPKNAFATLKAIMKEEMHMNLLASIEYEFTQSSSNTPLNIEENDLLYKCDGSPKESIEAHKLGRFIAKDSKSKEPIEPATNYLFDKIVYDSNIEKEVIVEENKEITLQNEAKKSVIVFAKLPKFKIPTPFKEYEPDFAYLLRDDSGQQIFFICETKGYEDALQIPEQEKKKIDYARKFFNALQEHLKNENIKVIYSTRINKQSLLQSMQEAIAKNKQYKGATQ